MDRTPRRQYARSRPLHGLGGDLSPADRHLASLPATEFDLKICRLAEDLLAVIRRELGSRKVYAHAEVDAVWREWRQGRAMSPADLAEVKRKVRSQINVSSPEAA